MLKNIIIITFILFGIVIAQDSVDTEETIFDSPYLVVGEVGLGGGFPGFQLYNTYFSFQKEKIGLAFKGSWTAVGPYIQASARYYTPIPVPVPTFVSAGVGNFGKTTTFMATVGAHIPLAIASPIRLTIEAGANYMNILGKDQILPTVSLGVGYSFFIDAEPLSKEELAQQEVEKRAEQAGCTNPKQPDSSIVGQALSDIIDGELNQARAAYAGTYELISYTKNLKTEVAGNIAHVSGTFTAKVKEVLSGKISEYDGSIDADLTWTGCAWTLDEYTIY